MQSEYVFFGGQRIAMVRAGSTPLYYVEDMLGTSRLITGNTGSVCYDGDFYPYGGERSYVNTCSQNYKFEGKERDSETGNDAFGARYYSNRFGRWLSSDWSSVPAPIPYANLTNPQTLNLYSMVADDPESFADLDGHVSLGLMFPGGGSINGLSCAYHPDSCETIEQQAAATQTLNQENARQAQQAAQNQSSVQANVVPSTVATNPQDKQPVITPGSIFQEKVNADDVKDGPVRLSVSLETPDGNPVSGASVMVGLREGASARVGSETGEKDNHGPLGRTAVIGVVGSVSQEQRANLVFTLSQGKSVIGSAKQPVHLVAGSASVSRKNMAKFVGGSHRYVDFSAP